MASYSVNPEIDSSIQPAEVHMEVNGTQVTFVKYPATSWSSASASFTILPPSMETYLNRAIRAKYNIRVTYGGTTTGSLLDNGRDALRSLPDLRMKLTEIVSFNGASYPVSTIFDVMADLAEHFDPVVRAKHQLAAPDTFQTYSDGVGAINNPLATYDNCEASQQKRGAVAVTAITRNGTSAVVDYELYCWLYIPQLLGVDCEDKQGLIRIRQIQVNSTFDMSAQKIVSHADGGASTISSCVVAQQSIPELVCKFISVPREMLPQGPLRYRHHRMERFITSYGAPVASNGTALVVSNNIQLQRVPRFMFCWVREADANKTINHSDTFCAIQSGFSVNFNNQSGLLASASLQDLWQMSRQCGLLDSWNEFNGLSFGPGFVNVGSVGSLVALEFGRHISLGANDLGVNSAGAFNFSLNVPFKNVNQNSSVANPTLYVVMCYDHDLVIHEGGEVLFELPVSPVGLVASGDGGLIKLPHRMGFNPQGAGFFDTLGKIHDFIKSNKLVSGISGALSNIPFLAPIAGPISQISKNMGYGSNGGGVISKSQLRDAIKNL